MLIIFDWDGTLIKNQVANEAAIRRLKTLGINVTREWIREAQKNQSHYSITKKAISSYTGITDDKLLTIIMVNLFQLHYLSVINEVNENALFLDFIDIIKIVKEKYRLKLALISNVYEGIIFPVLDKFNLRSLFDYVFANSNDLHYKKTDLINKIPKSEEIILMVGDRKEDMEAGKSLNIKTAFTVWGQEDYREFEDLVDFVINEPEDIKVIIDSIT
ncbi:MAG: HAD hydrolase-like protein [Nanoarchaeota archaeon]